MNIKNKLILIFLFIISLVILLTTRQSYTIALKDTDNNVKYITRTTSKKTAELIEERLKNIKEKILLTVINKNEIFQKHLFYNSPEIIAVSHYFLEGNEVSKKEIFLNPQYEEKYKLVPENFSSLDKIFKIPESDILQTGKIDNYISDVIFYIFTAKINEQRIVFITTLVPDVMSTPIRTQEGSYYTNYLISSNLDIVIHQDSSKLGKKIDILELKNFISSDNILGELTTEYKDEDSSEVIASLFKVKNSNLYTISKITKEDAYKEAKKLEMVLIITSLFVFIITVIISMLFARALVKPIIKLSKITKEIGQGNFLAKAEVETKDEIGALANSFNIMGEELYIRENKLKEAQKALVQSEKMGAFGQISAGIAHEVKNPLAGILGHAQLVREKISKNSFDKNSLEHSLCIIEKETTRCKDIIENLMKFARKEETVLEPHDISEIVSNAVKLVDHQLTINGVKIIREIKDNLSAVMLSPNEIKQVLMNLMINAQHAMASRPERILTVRVIDGKTNAIIELQDTGTGMPEEIKKHIFEPFFTTKPSGQGTGLGLSVSYGIIESHKGTIEVESEMDKGTKFIIKLPYAKEGTKALKIEKDEDLEDKNLKYKPQENENDTCKISLNNEEKGINTDESSDMDSNLITPEKEQINEESIPENILDNTDEIINIDNKDIQTDLEENNSKTLNQTTELEKPKKTKEKNMDYDFKLDYKVPRPKKK